MEARLADIEGEVEMAKVDAGVIAQAGSVEEALSSTFTGLSGILLAILAELRDIKDELEKARRPNA